MKLSTSRWQGRALQARGQAKCVTSQQAQPWKRSLLAFPFQIPNLRAYKAGGISSSLVCHYLWVLTLSPQGEGNVSLDNQLYGKDHLLLVQLFEQGPALQTLSRQWSSKLCIGLLF